ncbi:MAG: hypothetical protein LOD89_03585 [Tissierellales bacterium]
MTKQQIFQIAVEAAKIYFDYNVSVEEAIEKAKKMFFNRKEDKLRGRSYG